MESPNLREVMDTFRSIGKDYHLQQRLNRHPALGDWTESELEKRRFGISFF
jgi:hypothetical protein